ncbi:MAG: 3-isopropylmalate dehydratase small subunit [Sulfolobales archaeon]
MIVEGRVIKLGDKIDTDLIIPAKHLKYTDPQYLAQHVLETLDPEFSKKASKGVIVVAGKLFGMGSSREQAAIALKAAGVKMILAESFARIFFRNAINNGLPVMVCPNISNIVMDGDYVVANLSLGEVSIPEKNVVVKCKELPEIVIRIISAGGLIEYLKALGK